MNHKTRSKVDEKKALQMYQGGISISKIAKKYDVHRRVVDTILKENCFDIRPRSYYSQGEKNPAWKGNRKIDKDGYALVYKPNHPFARGSRRSYVREHRLVMENYLGRYLDPKEVIHHINGIHHDNRIENLKLYSSNGEHLAETLKGKCPQWTEEGRERILQAVRRRYKKHHPKKDA